MLGICYARGTSKHYKAALLNFGSMPHPQCLQEIKAFFTVLEALVYNKDRNIDLLSQTNGTILDCMLCSLLVSGGSVQLTRK